jgi:hypothetical protein
MTAALAVSDPPHPANHGNCQISRPAAEAFVPSLALVILSDPALSYVTFTTIGASVSAAVIAMASGRPITTL